MITTIHCISECDEREKNYVYIYMYVCIYVYIHRVHATRFICVSCVIFSIYMYIIYIYILYMYTVSLKTGNSHSVLKKSLFQQAGFKNNTRLWKSVTFLNMD